VSLQSRDILQDTERLLLWSRHFAKRSPLAKASRNTFPRQLQTNFESFPNNCCISRDCRLTGYFIINMWTVLPSFLIALYRPTLIHLGITISVNFYEITRRNIPEEVIFIPSSVTTWNLTNVLLQSEHRTPTNQQLAMKKMTQYRVIPKMLEVSHNNARTYSPVDDVWGRSAEVNIWA
jgi:hypothetical protein